MPLALSPSQQELPQQQPKSCPTCHSALVDNPPQIAPRACPTCTASNPSCTLESQEARSHCADREQTFSYHTAANEFEEQPRSMTVERPIAHNPEQVVGSPASSDLLTPDIPSSPSYDSHEEAPDQTRNPSPSPIIRHRDTAYLRSHEHPGRHSSSYHPLTDITHLRVPSEGHHCLYPGATFVGTQKSGRNSYEVSVTVVNCDMRRSFLCGYLRIRGLTNDWPELTTYFDAEIIGSRYGFLTQKWGSSEHQDMLHWCRFPAFRHVKNEMKKPYLTISDRDRGAVFMRWKEKFLVPDHRVQDVNGASFAGFYYVCVDFNSNQTGSISRSSSQSNPVSPDAAVPDAEPRSPEADSPTKRSAKSGLTSVHSQRMRPPAPVATMQGFYYHANSEPYQQLSLEHVPEWSGSSFEFR